jgi:hypothetical protein
MLHRPDVLTLFNTQLGVATAAQLREIGLSRSSVERSVRRGSIVPLLPGVFVQPGVDPSFEMKALAAQLYCGPRCFLSGQTAGALLGLRSMWRRPIRVTVPATARVTVPDWVRLRRVAYTATSDVITLESGHRVSCPLLTLFQLASELNEFGFHRAAEDMWKLELIGPDESRSYLSWIRRSGKGGVAVFEAWVEKVGDRARPSQSGLELDLLDSMLGAGVPEPERQFPLTLIGGKKIELDFAWPELRLAVEPGDSWWHGGEMGTRRDRARANACGEIGWQLHFLDESLKDDLPGVGRTVRNIYEARRNPPFAG